MQGKIVKGISGFYYVHVGEPGIYECKAKGAFRNQKIKPLVGDDVEIAIVDEETKKGNIEKILPRKNELIRPAVANIDLALIIFAAAKPKPTPGIARFSLQQTKSGTAPDTAAGRTSAPGPSHPSHSAALPGLPPGWRPPP